MTDPLVPYLPRLVLDWVKQTPDARVLEVPGSLVFVDLSGFTALSERLARAGREGAERITEIIDSTFTDLLEAAYADGGTLLKFGGDALLLLFADEGHELRAVRSSAEMRRRLNRTKAPERGVKLSMTVGVGSGSYHFFLVGSSHRELIVAGPAATRTAALEEAAEAGEIVVGTSTGAALGPHLLGDRRGAGRLLVEAPGSGPRSSGAVVRVETTRDVSALVPSAIRRHVAGGGSVPEHRHVSIAFVKFSGVDRIIRRDGADVAAERLDELVTAVQRTVDHHEICFLGTDIAPDGGKILLASGAPDALEDAEDRLLLAVRDISASSSWPLKIGVNAGWVFAGSVGPPYRRTYTVMGDAVNLAARVMAKSPARAVLATDELLDRAQTLFETRPLEPFMVKGKSEPVRASRVGTPTGVRQSRREDLPVLGREREIALLSDAIRRAAAGAGTTIELVGEGGIGKTTLLHAAIDADRSVSSIWVACEQHESTTPYASARRLVLATLGITPDVRRDRLARLVSEKVHQIAPDLAEWLPLIGTVIDAPFEATAQTAALDERFVRARMIATVVDLVGRALASHTVLVIDDAYWMDAASRDVLSALCAAAGERPWVVLPVSRPTSPRVVPDADALEVGPVAADAAVELARAVGGLALLPQTVTALAERAGGHPLFVIELASAAVASDAELPDTLASLIAARIDTLDPPARRVLRELSVLGSGGDDRLVADLAAQRGWDLERVWPSLESFMERDATGVRFRLAVFQAASYEGLPFRERRALHELAGFLLERRDGDPPLEALSLHFDRARSWLRSYMYSRSAAERASERYAYTDAVVLYGRAIEAARRTKPPADEVATVWHELGLATHRGGRSEEAIDAYRRARRLTRNRPLLGRLYFDEADANEQLGRLDPALRLFRRGIRTVEHETDARSITNRIRMLLGCVGVRLNQGKTAEAQRLCVSAIAAAEAAGDPGGLMHGYNLLFQIAKQTADPRADEYGRLSLETAEALGHQFHVGNALNNLGTHAQTRGRWDEAVSYFVRSRRAQEQAGSVVGAATVANNTAEIMSDQGHWDEAERTFTEALRAAGSFKLLELVATSNLGRVLSHKGSHERAHELLSSVLETLRAAGVAYYVAETEQRVAENLLVRGSWREALERLEPMSSAPAVERLRGYALWQSGDENGAREAFTRAREGAEVQDHPYEVALAHDALARLGGDDSGDHKARSTELFDELGVVRIADYAPGR